MHSSLRGVSAAFAFISVFVSLLWHFLLLGFAYLFIIIIVIIVVIIGYYCKLLLFPQSSWLCVTNAWAGLGIAGRACGWVAGRAGFWGALATWV